MEGLRRFLARLDGPLGSEAGFSEAEELKARIGEALRRLDHAWRNFDCAEAEYVDVAVWEICQAETAYNILNRKYRLLVGCERAPEGLLDGTRRSLPWLASASDNPYVEENAAGGEKTEAASGLGCLNGTSQSKQS